MGGALLIAATHWAVRSRRIRSTHWWARWVRGWSDPLLRPFERRVVGWGGNPQAAPLWLAVAALFVGLALILLVRWIVGVVLTLGAMEGAPPRAWLQLLVSAAASLLMAAILIRVVGSWLGAGRYARWMRPFYLLTDWIVEPIRKKLPPFGPVDLSPVAAYFLVFLLREILLGALR